MLLLGSMGYVVDNVGYSLRDCGAMIASLGHVRGSVCLREIAALLLALPTTPMAADTPFVAV